MSIVRWEDPPPHGLSGMSKYSATAAALRKRPGKWALVVEGLKTSTAGSLAYQIRKGREPFAPAASFESRCVGAAGGTDARVYARYVGGES